MFSGKAGTGKTYCADIVMQLCKDAGLSVFKSPFARGVKETAQFMGWDLNKSGSGRKLLQDIGAAGRAYDPNMWVKSAINHVMDQDEYPFDAIVIDDLRYRNELVYIIDNEPLYKVIPIRMYAPSRELLVGTPEYYDISETDLDEFPFDKENIINNEPGFGLYRSLVEGIVYAAFAKYAA